MNTTAARTNFTATYRGAIPVLVIGVGTTVQGGELVPRAVCVTEDGAPIILRGEAVNDLT